MMIAYVGSRELCPPYSVYRETVTYVFGRGGSLTVGVVHGQAALPSLRAADTVPLVLDSLRLHSVGQTLLEAAVAAGVAVVLVDVALLVEPAGIL